MPAAVTLVVVSFGVTGCRVGNDRTATVTEPSSSTLETDVANDDPVSRPADTTASATSPSTSTSSALSVASAGTTRTLSEQEIEELERELDEIDQLLSDTERAFTGD